MTPKTQGKNYLTLLLIINFTIIILFSNTVIATEYEFGFDNMSTSYTTELNLTAYSTYQHPIGIRFKDISVYEENVREIRVFVPAANIITPPSPAAYYRENVQLKVADKLSPTIYYNLANATVGWNYAASGLYINIFDITDWDTHSVTVETTIYWDGMTSAADWGNVVIYGGNSIGSGYNDPQDFYMYTQSDIYPVAEDHTIVSYQTWKNTYEHTTYDTYSTLDITKVLNGSTYQSKWNVSDENGNLMQETVLDGQNLSVLVYGDTIYINCTDEFGFYYTDELSNVPTPPPDDGVLNTLSGTIKDAKTNAIIPSNPINLSTATGYGGSYSTTSTGAGAYSITNIIDDIYYIQANRSGYENYTFEKNITSNTEHIIYMVENITLDANKSGVYGTVTNYYNATGVPTTWMKISNDTWYQITYTNQNGYYEFLNFAPGNYTIQAQKTGYFPYEAALTFTSNELKYVPIELVSEEIPPDPTPTPTPPATNILTPFRAIINSFGISESLGGAFIGIFIIIFMGALFSRAGTLAAIAGMFFGFISSIFMGLLPSYLLSITIIVVILLILRLRGDL